MPSTLCILLLGVFTVQALRVWPQPTLVEQGSDAQWVSRTFGLVAKLYCEENGTQVQKVLSYDTLRGLIQNISDWLRFYPSEQTNHELSEELILRDAVSRSLQTIKTTKFVPWKTHSRLSAFEPSPAVVDKPVMLNQLQLNQVFCPSADKLDSVAFFAGDESYELTVEQETASINSRSTLGSIRALQTFEQLFYASSNRSDVYIPNTPLQISDKPRWPHRGLLLDIARNVFSTEDVLRTIDAMASSKLNRLHLHATDSQSWPIEVPAFPHLASQGAYQPDQIWSSADLRRVQRYGVIRGVSVFLEIDMPGHTASIAHAYPDLIAAFNEPDWSNFAAEPLSGQLKLNSAPVYAFVDKLFDDLLPRLKQYTTIYHGGGDEVNMNAYLLDDTVRSSDPEVIRPLLQKFMDNIIEHARKHNLQPILWEEMLLDYNLTLPSVNDTGSKSDVVLQVWRNSKNLIRVLEQGYRVLFGDHEYWYLDCGYGAFLNPYPEGFSPPGVPYNSSGGRRSRLKAPYLDYCSPMNNWRHIYSYNPLVNISEDLYHLVQGGEVLLWSEQTDSVDLDAKLWPRAAAAAEVLWAGPRKSSMIDEAERRLAEWRERVLIDQKVRAGPVGMTWCLMEGRCHY